MAESEEKSLNQKIGELIQKARNTKGKGSDSERRVKWLLDAEKLILSCNEESLLDNFLDEMLEFVSEREDDELNSFTITFIQKAVKKDPDVLKKAILPLSWVLRHDTAYSTATQKKVIVACTQIYPYVLQWAYQHKNDQEVEKCWNSFTSLKVKILAFVESTNEGFRVHCLKFMEAVILSQSPRSAFSVVRPDQEIFCVSTGNLVDHRFVSQRQMESETNHNFDRLIDELSSSSITSQALLVILQIVCNIAKQRPERMARVLSILESLHVNLPPTLATHQVKSLRKELRYHMLRMLKHPTNFSNHSRLQQFLTELGCSGHEIERHMPERSEVAAALQKRSALAKSPGSGLGLPSGAFHQSEPSTSTGLKRPAEDAGGEGSKKFKLDDEEYLDEGTAEILRGAAAGGNSRENLADASQTAIDMTTEFVYERLTLNVVVKLVTISLFTLPDEMPPTFLSTYTRIDNGGSEEQRRDLARKMAIQLTKEGEGPGIKFIRDQKQQQYLARQNARMEGAVIPPTPGRDQAALSSASTAQYDPLVRPSAPKKARIVEWDIFKVTKELLVPEAYKLSQLAFKRIMTNEKAIQGGAILTQQQLLVRLASRYLSATHDEFAELLVEFILEDQKNRHELALLWLNELFAQYGGYSYVTEEKEEKRFVRYDKALCSMLGLLFNRKDHKEILFHQIFLSVPLVTKAALTWLKKACLDPVYGAFAIATLREMIFSRPRQREDLLNLLISFSFYETDESLERSGQAVFDIREQCVNTAKELYAVAYIRDDLRAVVIKMSQQLTSPTAPRELVIQARQLSEEEARELPEQIPWDEQLIRAGLHLFISLLPVEHTLQGEQNVECGDSLLHHLARMTATAINDVKRVTFRCIDQAIKSIGMHSAMLLDMIEGCPEGAEPLIARILHLLTERSAPTPELVDRVRRLRKKRDIDVRSLIPILTGLDRAELLELIPKFVVNATNSKSVPAFFKKLIFGRHILTHEPLLTPVQLLVQLHKVKSANIREEGHLVHYVDLLIVDQEGVYQLGKDVVAAAVEELISERPLPRLLYHSLQKIYEQHPSLKGFLTNVVGEVVRKGEGDVKLQQLLDKFAQSRDHPLTVQN